MKKYKIIIIIIISAGIIFLAGKLLTWKKSDVKDEENIIRVKRGDISVSVNVSAIIKSLKVMEIKSRINGEIIKMPVKKGEFLEEGALIAEIENNSIKPAVSQALAELKVAKDVLEKLKNEAEAEKNRDQRLLKTAEDNLKKVKLELQEAIEKIKTKEELEKNNISAESELIKQEVDVKFNINDIQEKISELNKKDPVPDKELKSLEARLKSAKSEYELVLQYLELTKVPVVEEKIDVEKFGIKQAELELVKAKEKMKAYETGKKDLIAAESEVFKKLEALRIAEDNLKGTIITAPISGTILHNNIEKGGIITPEMLNNSMGYTIASMANLENVYVNFNINEKDADEIKTDQLVKIIFDIFPENIFEGRIIKVTPKKVVIKGIKIFEITIEIKNQNTLLLPEMNVMFEMIIKENKNVLFVPNDVIQNVDNKKKVFVIQEGKPIQREVETGSYNRDFTEIISGLIEGEVINRPPQQ